MLTVLVFVAYFACVFGLLLRMDKDTDRNGYGYDQSGDRFLLHNGARVYAPSQHMKHTSEADVRLDSQSSSQSLAFEPGPYRYHWPKRRSLAGCNAQVIVITVAALLAMLAALCLCCIIIVVSHYGLCSTSHDQFVQ